MQLQYFKLDLDNKTMRQFYNYRRYERIILVANKYPLLNTRLTDKANTMP